MAILDQLLDELKNDPLTGIDESVKQLCDKIFDEEKGKFAHPSKMPKGANIFLAIECKGRDRGEVGYLCLERDAPSMFFVGYWSGSANNSTPSLKRVKSWEIKETTPEKILLDYARILKYLIKEKGE